MGRGRQGHFHSWISPIPSYSLLIFVSLTRESVAVRNIQQSRQLPLLAIKIWEAGWLLPCAILLLDMAQNYFNLILLCLLTFHLHIFSFLSPLQSFLTGTVFEVYAQQGYTLNILQAFMENHFYSTLFIPPLENYSDYPASSTFKYCKNLKYPQWEARLGKCCC